MEVGYILSTLVALTDKLLGLCTFELIDCCGGHLHHICTRFEEENESMGSHDRALC